MTQKPSERKKAESMTMREFFQQFPDDESCLQHLFDVRFGQGYCCPKCEREAKWYRIKATRAFSCQWCGHHIHPTVNTPFQRTRTPLQLWFYALFLFTTTRNGVSAKELQRQLGVTYKTAWRMGHEIRKHMAHVDGDKKLEGTVEVDETLVGGVAPMDKKMDNKTIVMGMVQRGGDVMATVVPNSFKRTLVPIVEANVKKGSKVNTDQFVGYKALQFYYEHEAVDHGRGEYVRGDCHRNTIEGFWSHLKKGLDSTHVRVSGKHLEKYVKEFEYRYNSRQNPREMFPRLVNSFLGLAQKPSTLEWSPAA